MSERHAAGRKTETPFEVVLTEQMALCRDAIGDCFKEARAWSVTNVEVPLDDGVRGRDHEFRNATSLMKACAELTLAAGKLKGEFDHRIRVTRDTADGANGAAGGTPLENSGSIPQ